jgi:hypothetical protein
MAAFTKTGQDLRKNRFLRRWISGAVLATVFGASFFALQFSGKTGRKQQVQTVSPTEPNLPRQRSSFAGIAASPTAAKIASRPLFPYSIIPGGIANARELKNAVANDSSVASHYADFDLAKAHAVKLDRNRMVFVSYRLGENIYWTRKRLALLKGETIITDGEHEARARCGNRLSDTAVAPVSPKEPAAEAMEAVQSPDLLAMNIPALEAPMDLLPSSIPEISAPASPGATSGGIVYPSAYPILAGGGPYPLVGPGGPGSSADISPVVTPEPGTLILFATGLIAFVPFARLCSIRKRRNA